MTTEEIILNKSWRELTADELNAVRELAADEASFNHVKSFMQQVQHVGAAEIYTPSPSVKSGLDAVFAKQHAARMPHPESFKVPASKVVPLYQRNWTKVAAAAIFVVTAILVWTWPGRQEIAPAAKIAQTDEPVVFSDWNPGGEKKEAASSDKVTEGAEKEKVDLSPSANRQLTLAQSESFSDTVQISYSEPGPVQVAAGRKDRYSDNAAETMKTGMNADLFPDSFHPGSVAAASEDLLSYIKPAF